VTTHSFGVPDGSVRAVAALSIDDRINLDSGMALLLSALGGDRVISQNDAEREIVRIGRDLGQRFGLEGFLKRAVILHADTAIYAALGAVTYGTETANQPVRTNSPLFVNRPLTLDKDGEVVGHVQSDWNWPFARSLLDLLRPKPSEDPFAAAWYHATTAFMLAHGLYGEAVAHLDRAGTLFPDDPQLLFDRGCYWEIQGLPMSQALLSDVDLSVLRGQRRASDGSRIVPGPGTQLGIPPEETANRDAERFFRRALRTDPSFGEARVRLGRLLIVRAHYQEALDELNAVLQTPQAPFVSFLAHLFAGRAAHALGRNDDARRHYLAARDLFPNAQSVLLAQSRLALAQSDVRNALRPLEELTGTESRARPNEDPWWQYSLGSGRDAVSRVAETWRLVQRNPR
jgi:tetratricopeptide (TPR) repeat protein